MTLAWPLIIAMQYWSGQGFSYQIKFGSHRAFLSNMTSGWPRLTPSWPLTSAIHYTLVRGFFLPNFVVRAFVRNLIYGWPSWPLHDLRLQQCITLWTGILPTKFGSHRAFLHNLTSGWPWLTPEWPLTPVMHYTLEWSSCNQIWYPQDIFKAIWSLYDPWPLVGSLQKVDHNPLASGPYCPSKFWCHVSKHHRMHK